MSDHDARPYPFDEAPSPRREDVAKATEEMERKLAVFAAKLSGKAMTPVARVAEVHMSRYTIEWIGSPLPEGATLYATAPAGIGQSEVEAGHG